MAISVLCTRRKKEDIRIVNQLYRTQHVTHVFTSIIGINVAKRYKNNRNTRKLHIDGLDPFCVHLPNVSHIYKKKSKFEIL